MSAQYPAGPDGGEGTPGSDSEPVDPYGDEPRQRPLPPPSAPFMAPGQPGYPPAGPQGYPGLGQPGYQPAGSQTYPGYGQPGYPSAGPQGYPGFGYQDHPPAGFGHHPTYGYRPYAVAPKSAGLAVLASLFVPGLGSMLNGETSKGIGILVGFLISFVLTTVLIGFAGILAFWIWGMVDASNGAQRWNARHGIVS